jgi:hypothetical protein
MKKFSLDSYSPTFSRNLLKVLIFGVFIVTTSCKSALYIPTVNEETGSTSLLELQDGRRLYVEKCGGCHTLYLPEKYTKADWQHWLNEMDSKVKVEPIEKERLLKYLTKGR